METRKKIVAFCCENSSYLAVDAVDEKSIIESVEIVRLPCAGKFEVSLALKSLEKGYEGVLVLACPIDNCKYVRGNLRAEKRAANTRALLQSAGIDERRVRMDHLSSVDGHKFVRIVREMLATLSEEQTIGAGDKRSV